MRKFIFFSFLFASFSLSAQSDYDRIIELTHRGNGCTFGYRSTKASFEKSLENDKKNYYQNIGELIIGNDSNDGHNESESKDYWFKEWGINNLENFINNNPQYLVNIKCPKVTLKQDDLNFFSKFTYLKTLHLYKNNLTSFVIPNIKNWSSLVQLRVTDNPISSFPPNISELRSLELLDLETDHKTKLTGTETFFTLITNLKNLKALDLDLGDTDITNKQALNIFLLVNYKLRHFNLSGGNSYDLSTTIVETKPNTDKDINKIQELFPKLEWARFDAMREFKFGKKI